MLMLLDSNFLLITFLVTVGMQLFFFAIAWTFRFDKVTDISGTMNFVLLSWLTFLSGETYYTRQIVSLILVNVWGVRLGFFLLSRVIKRGKDERFDKMREVCCSFFAFWVFQMIWVWTVSLPVTFLMANQIDQNFGPMDIIGYVCWGIGFIFESLADHSKSSFIDKTENKGKIIMDGVWHYSRHPNYFGEIMVWIGLFLTSGATYSVNDRSYQFVSILSPAFTAIILLFASGVTMAEQRYDSKYGKEQWYVDYKLRTSVLVPMPPSLWTCLPSIFRRFCCFDYKLYNRSSALAQQEV